MQNETQDNKVERRAEILEPVRVSALRLQVRIFDLLIYRNQVYRSRAVRRAACPTMVYLNTVYRKTVCQTMAYQKTAYPTNHHVQDRVCLAC